MINITNPKEKLTIESSSIIEINKTCVIRGMVHIDIPYKIVCDLSKIPHENHNIVIQTLMIK